MDKLIQVLLAPFRAITFASTLFYKYIVGMLILYPASMVWKGLRNLKGIVLAPPRLAWRGLCMVGRGLHRIWRGIVATPGTIWRSPLAAYRKVTTFRNWFLAKVEYLQSESAKWKTTFNILKAPTRF